MRAVLDALADEERGLTATEMPGPGARGRRDRVRLPGHEVGRRRADRAAGAGPARCVGATSSAAENDGHWRVSRPPLAPMDRWLGEVPAPLPSEEGYAELVRRWLRTFGPGHHDRHQVVAGLDRGRGAAGAGPARGGQVSLDRRSHRVGAADDLRRRSRVGPWAALLPVLDPTVMGWKERDFYLDPDHVPYLFDPTATPAPPPGGTAGWSAAGSRTRPGSCTSCSARTSGRGGVRRPWTRRPARLTGWLEGTGSARSTRRLPMRSATLP